MHMQKHTRVFKRGVRFRATITLDFQAFQFIFASIFIRLWFFFNLFDNSFDKYEIKSSFKSCYDHLWIFEDILYLQTEEK